jgi:hypothetical protein
MYIEYEYIPIVAPTVLITLLKNSVLEIYCINLKIIIDIIGKMVYRYLLMLLASELYHINSMVQT